MAVTDHITEEFYSSLANTTAEENHLAAWLGYKPSARDTIERILFPDN